MKKFNYTPILTAIACAAFAMAISSCDDLVGTPAPPPKSSSTGIVKADAKVKVGSDGLTVEQRNIKRRLETDNKVGSIKHLYILSAYSGDCLIYSTVDGKVTSGGKRLSNPQELRRLQVKGQNGGYAYKLVDAIQDDGTYGSSMPYLYWFDAKGVFHQHYVTGGQVPHISDQPVAVKSVIINMELSSDE